MEQDKKIWILRNDKTINLYNEIMNKISYKYPAEQIIPLIKEYSIEKMKLDFKGKVSTQKIEEIAGYIVEFIVESQNKGFFNNGNIYNNLKSIVFEHYDILQPGPIYGDCAGSILRLDPTYSMLRHVVFHELTHAVTPELGGIGGQYKPLKLKQNSLHVKSFNATVKYEPVFDGCARTLLRECIAESTACALADDYKVVKTHVQGGLYSDWQVHYNRLYHELGYEFLKTVPELFGGNDREAFKALTLEAMKPNNTIIDDIVSVYSRKHPDTWKEDLHTITSILGEVYSKNCVTPEQIANVKQMMKKYQQPPTIKLPDGYSKTPKIKLPERPSR